MCTASCRQYPHFLVSIFFHMHVMCVFVWRRGKAVSTQTNIVRLKQNAGNWRRPLSIVWGREKGEGVQKPAESSSGACGVIEKSLVGPTESSDSSWRGVGLTVVTQLNFPFGNCSFGSSRRPFPASHASDQLSLSASMEGQTNFRSKFSSCCGALSVATQLISRELKNEFPSAGAMLAWASLTAAKALTANNPDRPFGFDDVGDWFSSPHAGQMM